MCKHTVGLTIALSLVFLAAPLRAQQWLADRENSEGPGFKLGESLVLHLGVGLEGGFDSNATYANDAIKAGRLRITPYIDIATRSGARIKGTVNSVKLTPPKALFRFGFASFYDRYFAKDSSAVDKFNQKFNPFGFDTHLNFTILPERKVSVLGGVIYTKTIQPYESSQDAQSSHHVAPSFGFRFAPGGGTLTIEPKYRLNLLVFEDSQMATNSNRMSHDVSLTTAWRFWPKTSLLSNIIFAPVRFLKSGSQNVDSNPIRSYLGLQSLLLNKFGIKLLPGYGASFYQSGPNFDGFIGELALMFFITPYAKVTLGGKRDFVDSFYANYFVRTGGYLRYEQLFAGRLLLSLGASVYHRQYASYNSGTTWNNNGGTTVTMTPSSNERSDVWVNGTVGLEYRASDWMSIHLSGHLWVDATDFSYLYQATTNGATTSTQVDVNFIKFETFAGVRVHY